MAPDPRKAILVIEDDPGVATLQRRRLERAGFRVEVGTDVDAAMIRLSEGGIELVLMDYRLGSTTGLDLHRRMKAAGFDVPVIIERVDSLYTNLLTARRTHHAIA